MFILLLSRVKKQKFDYSQIFEEVQEALQFDEYAEACGELGAELGTDSPFADSFFTLDLFDQELRYKPILSSSDPS